MSGLVTMTPGTPLDYSGKSAVINANGGVDFEDITVLRLDDVFTPNFDNYRIVINATSTAGVNVAMRMAGSENVDAGTHYTEQSLNVDGSSPTGARNTKTSFSLLNVHSKQMAGCEAHVYGPRLLQPTAIRTVKVSDYNDAYITDTAGTHAPVPDPNVGYDGFVINTLSATTITGNIIVMGYAE